MERLLCAAAAVMLVAVLLVPASVANAVASSGGRTFYFAEGFTGDGFTETLTMLMPSQSGTATISYQTNTGPLAPITRSIAEAVPFVEDVNRDVGPNEEVSAVVSLSGAGVVERTMHFNNGGWHGSTDKVGVTATATEWNFAEGSTLSAFSEYLTLENPNPAPNAVTLTYYTDQAMHPVKHVTLLPSSRTTIEVFSGNTQDAAICLPGTGGTCGVGRGIAGVSVQIVASAPIVAERPMYVNGYDFGAGPIRDGHDGFGAEASSPLAPESAGPWFFAEGTTLPGFYEYLTIENPSAGIAHVSITYSDNLGRQTTRYLAVNPQSRFTVPVFQSQYGVGSGVSGVSANVYSNDEPIVAERSIYMVHNFGSGPVAGADVAGGLLGVYGKFFSFANASTAAGYNDFLAITNATIGVSNTIDITYETTGGQVTRKVVIPSQSRATVPLWDAAAGGLGPGRAPIGILVTKDVLGSGPFLAELVSYSSNAAGYGATDTYGYMSCIDTDLTCSP